MSRRTAGPRSTCNRPGGRKPDLRPRLEPDIRLNWPNVIALKVGLDFFPAGNAYFGPFSSASIAAPIRSARALT